MSTQRAPSLTWAQPANKGLIRQINEARVLDVLRSHGPVARARIAQITGLSPATVTQITALLIERARIRETESVRSARGRPAQLLELDRSSVRVIGVDLRQESLVAVALDLTGEVVHRSRMARRGPSPDLAADDVASLVRRMRRQIGTRELVGVGIAVSGTVDPERNAVVHSGLLDWDDVPLAEMIAARIKLPVHVARYVDSLAAAITLFSGSPARRLIIANVAPSIGISIVLGGQIQRQHQGRSGPIAHTRIDLSSDSGQTCHCGRSGCIETVASQWGISARLTEQGIHLPPSQWPDAQIDGVTARLHTGGTILGRALANIAKALDIERIVMSAPRHMQGAFSSSAQQSFAAEFDDPQESAPWTVSAADDVAAARGAACGTLAAMFYVDVNAQHERTY